MLVSKALLNNRHSFENKYQILQHFGLSTFLETEWIRLQVPSLLRTFWLTRCAQQVLVFSVRLISSPGFTRTFTLPTLDSIVVAITTTAKDLLTRGNETTMAVLGMTSIVAAVCHYIGSMFHFVLTQNKNGNIGGTENDEEKSVSKCTENSILALYSRVIYISAAMSPNLYVDCDIAGRFRFCSVVLRTGKNDKYIFAL